MKLFSTILLGLCLANLPTVKADDFIVYATPVVVGKSTVAPCPGTYTGYNQYLSTNNGGWFKVDTNSTTHTVTDTNRTDTHIVLLGRYGDNVCAQTTAGLPATPTSPSYRFGVYFTNNVPTNPYSVVVHGMKP